MSIESGSSIGITQGLHRIDTIQSQIKDDSQQIQDPRRPRRDEIGAWGRLRDFPRLSDQKTATVIAEREAKRAETTPVEIVNVAVLKKDNTQAPTAEKHVTWGGR